MASSPTRPPTTTSSPSFPLPASPPLTSDYIRILIEGVFTGFWYVFVNCLIFVPIMIINIAQQVRIDIFGFVLCVWHRFEPMHRFWSCLCCEFVFCFIFFIIYFVYFFLLRASLILDWFP
ncbi:hypothetical protein QJS04_geneDACA004947 [Acorus gramineus]|uniref:Transmembrane protein n=1 Tax=Acorus gramineus TaxID=55184 RepID=A0AAV9BV73_ACOGR|nr:hypothetical protein QJS04_geneDACA004947 [Acorus gramineus]